MTDEYWDKESVYDEQISPLMTQIIAICKEHDIPIVATFQYANTEDEGPANCTTCIAVAPRASEKIRRVAIAAQPERALVFAETHITNPDGSKAISIRRV